MDIPILDWGKKKLDSDIFPLGHSNFRWGAWFPFNKGQSTFHCGSNKMHNTHDKIFLNLKVYNRNYCRMDAVAVVLTDFESAVTPSPN